MTWEDIATRLGVALLLGGAIGLERQWRSRYVGLRTNTLLTIGSAAMMIFALMLPSNNDPAGLVHIVAGIITGVGFLGAGVIVKEGVTVKGFNTAATLWCSVAVGLFAGAGFFTAAVILSCFIVLVNLFLRPLVYLINQRAGSEKPEAPSANIE